MSLERYICRVTIVLADLKTYLGSLFFLGPPLVLRNNCRRYNISHVICINIYILFGNKVIIRIQKSWFGFIT